MKMTPSILMAAMALLMSGLSASALVTVEQAERNEPITISDQQQAMVADAQYRQVKQEASQTEMESSTAAASILSLPNGTPSTTVGKPTTGNWISTLLFGVLIAGIGWLCWEYSVAPSR